MISQQFDKPGLFDLRHDVLFYRELVCAGSQGGLRFSMLDPQMRAVYGVLCLGSRDPLPWRLWDHGLLRPGLKNY